MLNLISDLRFLDRLIFNELLLFLFWLFSRSDPTDLHISGELFPQFCVLWGPGCCGSSPFWRREGSWLFHESSSACRGALCCHQIHLPLTPEASRLSHPTFILPWFSFCLSWIKWRFECIHIPRVYGISLNFYHSWQHGSVGPYLNHSWPIEFMILFILSCHQED